MKVLNLILIIVLCTPQLATAIEPEKIYDLTLSLENEIIKNEGLFIAKGFPSSDRNKSVKPFRLEIKSFNNQTLYEKYFEFELIKSFHPFELYEKPVIKLSLSHFNNANNILIYQEEKQVLDIDVSVFSDREILKTNNSELASFLEEDVSISREFSNVTLKKGETINVNLEIKNNCDCIIKGILSENYPNYIKINNEISKDLSLQPLSTKVISYSLTLESNSKDSEIKIDPSIFKTENSNLFLSNSNIIRIESVNYIEYLLILGGIVIVFIIYKFLKNRF